MRYLLTFVLAMSVAVPVFADIMIIEDDDGILISHPVNATPYTDACDNISLGYLVWNTTATGDPGPSDMAAYDAVFWLTGSTTDLEPNDAIPTALAAYYTGATGHVFVEGGEVAFDCIQNVSGDVLGAALGVEDWDDDGGSITGLECLDTGHTLFTTPNAITTPLAYSFGNYGDVDGMNYMSGTIALLRNNFYTGPGHENMSVLDSGGKTAITLSVATYGIVDQGNFTSLLENILDYMGLTPSGIESASLGEIKAVYK